MDGGRFWFLHEGFIAWPAVLLAASLVWSAAVTAQPAATPLVLETKIPLGQISGRIDHLGIDVKRQRLFVAELGNNSVGVVDLAAGDDLAPIGRIELGNDADNVRVDIRRDRVLVGYGNGALAVIDPATRTKAADIRLKGHPEGFQLDESGTEVFVNVPGAREIEVADLASEATRSLPTQGAGSNFPMAIDRDAHRVLVVFRSPPTLMARSSEDRRIVAKTETCGDADDVFVDAKRHLVYVSCGEGVVDVVEQVETGYRRLTRVTTLSGARTSLFVPELDRLFVAVRARSKEPAAIWVFRPVP